MEVKNNFNNNHTHFGMAFLKPKYVRQAGGKIQEDAMGAVAAFERDIFEGQDQKLMSRAIRQLIGKHADNKHYDIRYVPNQNPQHYDVEVVDKAGNVVTSYSGSFHAGSFYHYTPDYYIKESTLKRTLSHKAKYYMKAGLAGIRQWYRRLVNPMSELPHAFQQASRDAIKLDKAALQKEANLRKVNTIFNEG